jgi:hypothetical protein
MGHKKGLENLIRMLKPNGTLYISFPIGRSDQVHFNAHRVFHPQTILNFKCVENNLCLENFDYVDDRGDLHINADIGSVGEDVRYGCGIYTFRRLPKSPQTVS